MFSRTYCWRTGRKTLTETGAYAHNCCFRQKKSGLGCTGPRLQRARIFGCKYVDKKTRSISQKATLEPANKAE